MWNQAGARLTSGIAGVRRRWRGWRSSGRSSGRTSSAEARPAYADPVTGDALNGLEYATRQAQTLLRHPLFVVGFNLITLTLMLLGLREQWNYFASWLAIMIEWIVGTFMWSQTRKDAVVIREIRSLARQMARDVEQIEDVVDVIERDVEGEVKQP